MYDVMGSRNSRDKFAAAEVEAVVLMIRMLVQDERGEAGTLLGKFTR